MYKHVSSNNFSDNEDDRVYCKDFWDLTCHKLFCRHSQRDQDKLWFKASRICLSREIHLAVSISNLPSLFDFGQNPNLSVIPGKLHYEVEILSRKYRYFNIIETH